MGWRPPRPEEYIGLRQLRDEDSETQQKWEKWQIHGNQTTNQLKFEANLLTNRFLLPDEEVKDASGCLPTSKMTSKTPTSASKSTSLALLAL